MADEADLGNYQAEAMLSAYIEKVRRESTVGPKPTGLCLNCDEPVEDRMFCSADCREDYERRENIHRRLSR